MGAVHPLRAILIWVTCTASWGHGDVQVHAAPEGHGWGPTATGVCADDYGCLNVCGLCCILKPYWCPWSMLLLKAMLIWVAWAATWSCVGVCDLGYLQGSCTWGPWPWCVLSPETMWKPLIHAPADYKEQWWLQMHSWEKGQEIVLWQPLPLSQFSHPPSKPLTELLKSVKHSPVVVAFIF